MILFSSDTAEGQRIAWALDLARGRERLLPFARGLTPSYPGGFDWGKLDGTFAGRLLLAASLYQAVYGKLPTEKEATAILEHVRQFREIGWSITDDEVRSWVSVGAERTR